MSKLQHGFTIIETLIGLVVIAALIGGGWYVWHKNHNAKPAANNTSTSSANPSSDVVKTKSATPTQKYLVIKEWGVEFQIPGMLKTLSYGFHNDYGPKGVFLDSQDLYNLAANSQWCVNNAGYLGLLTRWTTKQTNPAGTDNTIAKIGIYYYYYAHSQQGCFPSQYNPNGDSTKYASNTFQDQAENQIQSSLKDTLKAIQ